MRNAQRFTVRAIAPFVTLGLAEIALFFHDPGHFFIADTLVWMEYRHRSFSEFLSGFFQVDPGLWYRPLAQRTVESLLFPFVGFNPLPYRVIGFVLFFACTAGVYLLARSLTTNNRIAWLSVLVFTPHLLHTFPTYDASFTPELVFTLFYIASTLLFIRFLRTDIGWALVGSAALFVASLLSKEAAVSLPFTLVAIWILLPRKQRGKIWSVLPHFAILGVYLVIAVGLLDVRHIDFVDFLGRGESTPSEYAFGIGPHVLTNMELSFSWVFGIPQSDHGFWLFDSPRKLFILEWLRVFFVAGSVCVLFTSRRRFLLLGIAWFLTTASAGLLLVTHFLPYYLFAPLAGFALAMATIIDWVYVELRALMPRIAVAAPVTLLAVWTVIHVNTGRGIAESHILLGNGARVSATTIRDIRSLYPKLPKRTHVVLFNEDAPTAYRDHGGVLLQLAYNDPSLTMHYVTPGFSLPLEELNAGRVVVLKWVDDRIVDITSLVSQRPEVLAPHPPSTNYHLELSSPERSAGGASYVVRVPELAHASAVVLYAIDGVVMEPLTIDLDDRGAARVDLSPAAKPGTYTFFAVRRATDTTWVPVSRSIRVGQAY